MGFSSEAGLQQENPNCGRVAQPQRICDVHSIGWRHSMRLRSKRGWFSGFSLLASRMSVIDSVNL